MGVLVLRRPAKQEKSLAGNRLHKNYIEKPYPANWIQATPCYRGVLLQEEVLRAKKRPAMAVGLIRRERDLFAGNRDRAEQPVRFVLWAGGEQQRGLWSSGGAISKMK